MSTKSRFYDEVGLRRELSFVPSVAAATTTEAHPVFVAPCSCKVMAVNIVPQAAVTGDASHRKNLNLINAGSAGAGDTEVGNLDLAANVNLVAFDSMNIPLNATYLAPGVSMSEGDVLTLQFEKVGNGVLVPNLIVDVWYVTV